MADRRVCKCGEWGPVPAVDVWHDRALFHFLTEDASRQRYRARDFEKMFRMTAA